MSILTDAICRGISCGRDKCPLFDPYGSCYARHGEKIVVKLMMKADSEYIALKSLCDKRHNLNDCDTIIRALPKTTLL